jgi:acyl-CoA synthetase (AMP-forming)/AMP-acid ligase II
MTRRQPLIFKSPYPDVIIPDDISFTDFIFGATTELADKVAIRDGSSGRSYTYGQLIDTIKKAAAGLAGRGFKKGDVFAIYLPNVPEYAIAFHAVASLGGINTTINPLYTAGELAKQLNDSGARFLLTIPAFLDKAREAAAASSLEEIFVLGKADGATPFTDLLQTAGSPPRVEINPKQDLIVLPYSSGTTGLPKGVMLTHYNLIANVCQIQDINPIEAEDNLIAILPFFHIYGMVVVMSLGLLRGATLVTMPRFELEPFLQLMQEHNITQAFLVPPIVLALAKHPLVDRYNFSSLDLIFCGAAPLGTEVSQAAAKRLGVVVKQGYGMTEMSPVTHMDSQDPARVRYGTVGHCIPNTECKLVSTEDGSELGKNQDGELWIRGPQAMRGYLNNPEATAACLDDEGWYHSGDVARVDDDGYFHIVDRVKELIKYKGMQVAPAELEALLLTHPAIADAAVIPSPDEEAGEIPKAFVVLKSETTPDEIMAFPRSARDTPR